MLEIFVRNPVVQVSIIKFHVQWMTLQCLKNDDPQMVGNAQGLTCATLSTFGAIFDHFCCKMMQNGNWDFTAMRLVYQSVLCGFQHDFCKVHRKLKIQCDRAQTFRLGQPQQPLEADGHPPLAKCLWFLLTLYGFMRFFRLVVRLFASLFPALL